ncbi:MAG: tetratricopeptide repeat protein [Deltaproteobacteria bacterium]|nr:tetratricopeptide repeat protein [Deltaproteobacteria bacterium]
MIRLLFLALIPLFLLTGLARAGEEALVITETVQLRVADGFLAQQEYYRAVTEYLRFRLLFPDSTKGDYALLQIGRAYGQGGEPERAIQSYRSLREVFPGSSLIVQSKYLEGLAAWRGKKPHQAREIFEALARDDPQTDQAPRALAAAALIHLEEDDPRGAGEALDLFLARYPEHPRAEKVQEADRLLADYRSLPQKSEVLAGILSGILPGAGYAYAEEFATGFLSLGVNGAFVAATWTAFAQGLEAVGILAGGVGLPFYIGNIYGSVLAARKWNQAVKKQARNPVQAALDFVFE